MLSGYNKGPRLWKPLKKKINLFVAPLSTFDVVMFGRFEEKCRRSLVRLQTPDMIMINHKLSTLIIYVIMVSDQMSIRMSDRISDQMSDRMSDRMSKAKET